jgi:hypothetical protein
MLSEVTTFPPQDEGRFERDVRELFRKRLVARPDLASALYASLCNVEWQREGLARSVTWRNASALVAELVGDTHDLDFYCSGGEGAVDSEVAVVLAERGWRPETDHTKWVSDPRPAGGGPIPG